MVTDSISAFASETWRKLAHRCLTISPSLLLKHIDLVVERLLCAKPFGHYSIALNGKPSPLRRSAPKSCISLYCRLISLILGAAQWQGQVMKPFDHPRGPQCHARPLWHICGHFLATVSQFDQTSQDPYAQRPRCSLGIVEPRRQRLCPARKSGAWHHVDAFGENVLSYATACIYSCLI